MQKYINSVTNQRGQPLQGALITVTLLTGAIPTIYSDNGVTPITTPLLTDSNGAFAFYAADGRYNITVTRADITPINLTDILFEDLVNNNIALKNTANVFTKPQVVTPITNGAVSGTYTLDLSQSNNFVLTLVGNTTFADPINPTAGMVINIEIIQGGLGSFTLTRSSKMLFVGGAPTLSTAAGAVDLISMIYDAANSRYLCGFSKGFA